MVWFANTLGANVSYFVVALVYSNQTGQITGHSDVGREFCITAGVRQGCALSPRLFCDKNWRCDVSNEQAEVNDRSEFDLSVALAFFEPNWRIKTGSRQVLENPEIFPGLKLVPKSFKRSLSNVEVFGLVKCCVQSSGRMVFKHHGR